MKTVLPMSASVSSFFISAFLVLFGYKGRELGGTYAIPSVVLVVFRPILIVHLGGCVESDHWVSLGYFCVEQTRIECQIWVVAS